MHHTLAYTIATGGSVADADMTAASDSEISQRNNHYLLTEQYKLMATGVFGANVSRMNIQVPLWNQITRFNVWPVNKSLTIPSPPQLDYWDSYGPPLPQNEEITLKITDSANEQATAFMWIVPPSWNRNLPAGMGQLPIFEARLTVTTPSLVANTWSGLSTPVFEQSLRSGTYAIVSAAIIGTGLLAARFVFPRAPIYQNRKLRPGVLCQNAVGDLEWQPLERTRFIWGEYGRFSTVELPQIEYWGNANGAVTTELRWWMVWVNESTTVQYA